MEKENKFSSLYELAKDHLTEDDKEILTRIVTRRHPARDIKILCKLVREFLPNKEIHGKDLREETLTEMLLREDPLYDLRAEEKLTT